MKATRDIPVWDDGEGPEFPTLRETVDTDVCVVGLGGSGLSCLAELRALGIEAVGIDAGVVGNGAAGRNGGLLLSGLPDFYHRAVERFGRERARTFYRLTVERIGQMAAETPDLVRQTGSLRIAASDRERDDCRAQMEALEADNLPVEWYEGPEGEGLLIPTDGVYQPLRRCQALASRLSADGVKLFERTAAERIRTGTVQTPAGRIRCRRVIVAVDGALERLVPDLEGLVRTARIQMLATAPDPGVNLPRPVYCRWGYDFWQQLPDGRIVVGGTRDKGGPDEWSVRAVSTEPVQRELNYLLHRIGVNAAVTHRWAGVAGYSGDGLPVFGEAGEGVLTVGGYSGTGNVLGTLLGREAALWAAGRGSPWRELLRRE